MDGFDDADDLGCVLRFDCQGIPQAHMLIQHPIEIVAVNHKEIVEGIVLFYSYQLLTAECRCAVFVLHKFQRHLTLGVCTVFYILCPVFTGNLCLISALVALKLENDVLRRMFGIFLLLIGIREIYKGIKK